MKPHAEMNEGPEALKRFEDTMKAIFSKRKAGVLRADQTTAKTDKATTKGTHNQNGK
jgi:hypothetical protein